MTALQQLGMVDTVKVTIGKNPKQATRLEIGGMSVSVSALYKVEEFINLFDDDRLTQNSIAKSKYNDCNAPDEYTELSMWNDRMATYVKKCIYQYATANLNEILTWTCEDFGVDYKTITELHEHWNMDKDARKVSLDKCKDLIYKNGLYTPLASLRATCKEWLTAHGKYDLYKNHIDDVIYKWVKVGG